MVGHPGHPGHVVSLPGVMTPPYLRDGQCGPQRLPERPTPTAFGTGSRCGGREGRRRRGEGGSSPVELDEPRRQTGDHPEAVAAERRGQRGPRRAEWRQRCGRQLVQPQGVRAEQQAGPESTARTAPIAVDPDGGRGLRGLDDRGSRTAASGAAAAALAVDRVDDDGTVTASTASANDMSPGLRGQPGEERPHLLRQLQRPTPAGTGTGSCPALQAWPGRPGRPRRAARSPR